MAVPLLRSFSQALELVCETFPSQESDVQAENFAAAVGFSSFSIFLKHFVIIINMRI